MGSFTEGVEVSIDDPEWSTILPIPGQIIEVLISGSDIPLIDFEAHAMFFIKEVGTELDGSHVLHVRLLGCDNEDVGEKLDERFGEGVGRLHLCLSRPCVTSRELYATHITKFRLWTVAGARRCEYYRRGAATLIKELQKELQPPKRAGPKKPPGAGKPTGAGKSPRTRTREPRSTEGKGKEDVAELRLKLRKKLAGLRDDGKKKRQEREDEGSPPGEEAEEIDSSEESYAPSPGELRTGSLLGGPPLPPALADAEAGQARRIHREASKGSSTGDWSVQLLRKAAQVAEHQKKKRKKKKGGHHQSGQEAVRELAKILTKVGSKKKRKKKGGEDPPGPTSSSSEDSRSTSKGEKEDSDSDLEAPMKKKSRDRPGSVLALLVNHIRNVMEQGALADVPGRLPQITGGVKVASYFALHIKPHFGQFQRELREMFSLAATLDLLRSGDMARVGDSLSARFIALHQFMIDQGWSTARHMELHSMDDGQAAGAAMVLASRKHSRLVDKVQGKGWSNASWGTKGKGKGWPVRSRADPTGETKGDRPKGREKGKKGNNKGGGGKWDAKVQDWDKSRDKGEEK